MSRQERLDYLNTARNERRVQRYDDQLVGTEALVLVYPAWWYGMPAMLKGYFDRVWLPGVAFDVQPDGRVSTDRLKSLRRIVVITTYGGSWWMVRLATGDPARRLIGRALRALCARDCKVRSLQHGPCPATAAGAFPGTHPHWCCPAVVDAIGLALLAFPFAPREKRHERPSHPRAARRCARREDEP